MEIIQMKRFEYREVDVDPDCDIIKFLNEMGDKGWELIDLITGSAHYKLSGLFKREKNQKEMIYA